uniref:FAD-binding protein n=1 Tax=Roseihalotalea indica TaxID=2867963 RepID=A0AA49JB01_9BACT|nr:FAD-binding protein [Tunicatimonas sp. TK19036]
MKRKEFLKTSSALVAGSFLSPLSPYKAYSKEMVRKNWAGNYTYKAKNLHEPKTVKEIQKLVKTLDLQKPLGSRHCFNDIADSPLNQISTQYLNKVLEVDKKAKTITVEAGVRYGDFAPELDEQGFALHNLASLPHISVAGACVTATHGSGVENGNLSTAVAGLEFVTPEGELVTLTRDKNGDTFKGAVVNLGGLGLITKVTLDMQETYNVRQDLFQELPLASLKDHFDDIMSAGYSVSLFTDWQNDTVSQIWVKRKVDGNTKDMDADFYGAQAATKNLHPITRLSAENCTDQMGVPGPWYNRLPHFKMGFTPSSGEELQSEFFVPRENAVDAILALEKKGDQIYPQLLISEIRTIAADDFWMSPCYQQDCVAIHFTWKQNWDEVRKLLPMIEAELSPYNFRPHWGKLFTIAPEDLHSRYEKLPDFLELMKTYDPERKLRNAYLETNIYS